MTLAMNNIRLALVWVIIVASSAAATTPTPGEPRVAASLSDQPIVLARLETALSDQTRSILTNRSSETARAWVFFTDKGVTDASGFQRLAAGVNLTERALKRRAKVGLDKVVFADLPVNEHYVEVIRSLGATPRRLSRWLNAASFEIPMARLEAVAALPFVVEIRPVMSYSTPLPRSEDDAGEPSGPETVAAGDQYGASAAQLAQINVLNAHQAGWTGAGVTLTILDTGFRKTHRAFAAHYAHNRVLGEHDFIFDDNNTANQTGDASTQWNHGTYIWSVSAGEAYNHVYGPAYEANIILCKTEDVRSETQVEEDNWVAALEYADSIGTDVITSSLGYLAFDTGADYAYQDMDGQTATTSIAASTCDGLGIVLCNSMGNSGPGTGTISAPADASGILAVGNVTAAGVIASSSSRGPTYDGRTKPEVCARGTSVACANASGDSAYTTASGTSLSTPLIAGAACLVIEAHPDWTPAEVRESLKMTADRAAIPDNTYGWGVINVMSAIAWNPHGSCCVGPTVGNLDGSQDMLVTMGDLTVLIDHLYISLRALSCPEAADLDQSGQPDPENSDITINDLQVMIDHLFILPAPFPACP